MFLHKKEIIYKTKKLLNNISDLKEKAKKNKLTELELYELNFLIKVLNDLTLEQQKIIAYRYFENRTQKQIAEWLFISKNTVSRKLDKIILQIGRVIYGLEKELWDIVEGGEEKKEEEELINKIAERAVKKILNEIKEEVC